MRGRDPRIHSSTRASGGMDRRVKPTAVRLRQRWTRCMAWIQLCFARTTVERSSESPSHAVPIYGVRSNAESGVAGLVRAGGERARSEEHTSELQSLMRISYDVFCLKKKKEKRKE